MAGAFGERVTIDGDSASVQAVTRANAEQARKGRCAGRPEPPMGKADTAGRTSEARRCSRCAGDGESTCTRKADEHGQA